MGRTSEAIQPSTAQITELLFKNSKDYMSPCSSTWNIVFDFNEENAHLNLAVGLIFVFFFNNLV